MIEAKGAVVGRVNSDGTRNCGGGFSSSQNNRTGDYKVTFDTPFVNPPVVTATAVADSRDNTRTVTIYQLSRNSFDVTVRSSSGDRKNTSFNFIAVECFG